MWVCSPCGVEVHSSGRIAVGSLKIRPRPLGLSQYSKWFQSLFKSCRRERSPGEICSTMMIQSVYTEEWKKKKKKILLLDFFLSRREWTSLSEQKQKTQSNKIRKTSGKKMKDEMKNILNIFLKMYRHLECQQL